MPVRQSNDVYAGLRETLISPNESDRNWEPANVVDGLFAVHRSLRLLAEVQSWIWLAEHGDPEQREQAIRKLGRSLEA